MKHSLRLIAGLILLVLLVPGTYLYASNLMDTVYQYRSPLKNTPPAPGPALGKPLTRRLVFVLVDALREDTSQNTAVMPELNRLRQLGAWARMHSRAPSYSQPAYTVLLTGAWPDISDGPAFNLDYEDTPTFTQDNLFLAASRNGLKSVLSGHYWFQKLVPQETLSASFYTKQEDKVADREVVDAALSWLKSGNHQLAFIHLDQVDYAGHYEGGPRDPRWDAAAERVDALIVEITSALDLSQDTLFICSDHGQIDQGGHGGQDAVTEVEPFILVGAGVKPGNYGDVQMVDVAPTLATLLGASLPASSQGRVLTQMLLLSENQLQNLVPAVQAQQSRLAQAYFSAIGASAPINAELEPIAATQNAIQKAHDLRQNSERWPRAIIAGMLFILPLVGVYGYRKQKKLAFTPLIWLAVGSLVYFFVFHLRFAVLDHNPYSFSMVASQGQLLVYMISTVNIAFFLAWLVFIFGRKTYQLSPRLAAEQILGFVFMLLYCCAIPVLWYFTLYGATVTWTLPDVGSLFLALIFLIQILVISASGIIFSGLTALIVFLRKPSGKKPDLRA